MIAARSGADEAVKELLRWGANANKKKPVDGHTALSFAVQSKSQSTISLLAPVTETGLERVLSILAEEQVEITKPLEEFIDRVATDCLVSDVRFDDAALGSLLICKGRKLPGFFTWEQREKAVDRSMSIQMGSLNFWDSEGDKSVGAASSLGVQENSTVMGGLLDASSFGHAALVKLLLGKVGRELPEWFAQKLLEEAVWSDCKETCAAILTLIKGSASEEVIKIAMQRRRSDIIQLIAPQADFKDKTTASKHDLKQNILQQKVRFVERLPKSEEFGYNNEMERVRPLLQLGLELPFTSLLKAIHLPEAHIEAECPSSCPQPDKCDKMRQVFNLIKLIVLKMGEINPVFKLGTGRHPSIVGSLKEGTRCFFFNEMDTHVSLNKSLRNHCSFDAKKQRIVVTEQEPSGTLYIKKYVKGNEFDSAAYFDDFIETLAESIQQVRIADGFEIGNNHYGFTMFPLTLSYEPCLRCMEVSDHLRPQAKRCRHRTDCAAHHQQGLSECSNNCEGVCNFFSHKKTCDCQEFSSPSVTITKIGAAIHVKFPDGSMVDCDLNVPTIPTSSEYDGTVYGVLNYLRRAKPVGWLDEWKKVEDQSNAMYSPHLLEAKSWQVKMRRVNKDTVLARQVTKI